MSSKEWSHIPPRQRGLYWFYGYAQNKEIDRFPRLHLVVLEHSSAHFGYVYRTGRTTIKLETGAHGLWKEIECPEIPALTAAFEEAADHAAKKERKISELEFME